MKKQFVILFLLFTTIVNAQWIYNYYPHKRYNYDYSYSSNVELKYPTTLNFYIGYSLGSSTPNNINHGMNYSVLTSINSVMFGVDVKMMFSDPLQYNLSHCISGVVGYNGKYFGVGVVLGCAGINDQLLHKNGDFRTGYDYYLGSYRYYDPYYNYNYYSSDYKFEYGLLLIQNIPIKDKSFGISIMEQSTRYSWFSIGIGFYYKWK